MGRKASVPTSKQQLELLRMRAEGRPVKEIAEHFGLAPRTVYKRCQEIEGEIAKKAPMVQTWMKGFEVMAGEKLMEAFEQMSKDKFSDASLTVLVQSASTLNQMRRLEGGQATQVSEVKYSKVDIEEFRKTTQPIDITEDAQLVEGDTTNSNVQNNERVPDND